MENKIKKVITRLLTGLFVGGLIGLNIGQYINNKRIQKNLESETMWYLKCKKELEDLKAKSDIIFE